jgi:LemA protein
MGTLESVAKWQSVATGTGIDRVRVEAENQLSGALRHLLALADQHPELRASAEFQALAQTIENVEESLHGARRRYNSTVLDYNRRIRTFPGYFLAALLGLRPQPLLSLPAEETAASAAIESPKFR